MKIERLISGAVVAALFAVSGLLSAGEPKTIITGEQMELQKGGKVVIFSGGARVEKGQDVLTAAKIVQDKKKNQVIASGNVVFRSHSQDGEPIKGSAQRAFYDLGSGQGELSEGKPEMLYYVKTSTSPMILRAGVISFDDDKNQLHARNNVEIITSSVTAYAPDAVMTGKDKKVVLTGTSPQPLVIYYQGTKRNRYNADKVTFYAGGDKVLLKGRVKAVMTVEDKKAK